MGAADRPDGKAESAPRTSKRTAARTPATSGLTLAILGQSTGAGVVVFSPSSTSITLSAPV